MSKSKTFSSFALIVFVLALTNAMAQRPENGADVLKFEREVRLVDQAAAKAILERDEAAIDLYFARDSVTNNPRGGLTHGTEGVKALFRNGVINYASFERTIESIQVRGNTAKVMGNEVLTERLKTGEVGPPIRRRYTNVWMKNGSKWQIVARHASIVSN